MSRYRIVFKRSAEKALDKLPRQVQDRTRAAVDSLEEEPRPRGVRQLEGEEDL